MRWCAALTAVVSSAPLTSHGMESGGEEEVMDSRCDRAARGSW